MENNPMQEDTKQTQTKTKQATKVKLGLATLALLAAGGLAFAALPSYKNMSLEKFSLNDKTQGLNSQRTDSSKLKVNSKVDNKVPSSFELKKDTIALGLDTIELKECGEQKYGWK